MVKGPVTKVWKVREKPHRQDRRWVVAWIPEQIANRLIMKFPGDLSVRISQKVLHRLVESGVSACVRFVYE
jgi:hypothetical protein